MDWYFSDFGCQIEKNSTWIQRSVATIGSTLEGLGLG